MEKGSNTDLGDTYSNGGRPEVMEQLQNWVNNNASYIGKQAIPPFDIEMDNVRELELITELAIIPTGLAVEVIRET